MKVAPKADSIHEEFKLKQILFNTGIIKGRAGLRGNFTGAGSTATGGERHYFQCSGLQESLMMRWIKEECLLGR